MKYYILIILLLFLVECAVVTHGAAVPKTEPFKPSAVIARLSWEHGHPERAAWSAELFKKISASLPVFENAQDLEDFCRLSAESPPTISMAEMFVQISFYESGWDPKSLYQEPPPPRGPGTLSIGLFQMSYGDGDGCPAGKTGADLTDPIVNIDCAVNKAVALIKHSGKITGMAAYWSTMRKAHYLKQIEASIQGECK